MSAPAAALRAAEYDAWYRTPRGSWIGETEYRLLLGLLAPAAGATLLDVGCGTGYFTRRFAREAGLSATGLDANPEWLAFARARAAPGESYLEGNALDLPFPDASFDYAVSVTALCFIAEERRALAEMLRVTRRRFALGLLNRRSILYWQKGRGGGSGAYRGAHWHTPGEAAALLEGFPVVDVRIRTAVFVPGGGALARLVERHMPAGCPWGAFIAVAGSVAAARR